MLQEGYLPYSSFFFFQFYTVNVKGLCLWRVKGPSKVPFIAYIS